MLCRLLLFVMLASGASFACTCGEAAPRPCPWGKPGTIAFSGTVLSIENPPADSDKTYANDRGSGKAHYRFRIDEAFFGVKGSEIDIYSGRGGADCSYHFKPGEKYLVLPYRNNGKLFATVCSKTRLYNAGDPIIAEFRAIRDHKQVASVFGRLQKAVDPFAGPYETVPLSGIEIQFTDVSGARTLWSTTDAAGIYSVDDLPPGKYHIVAKLPAGLELPTPTLEFPAGACYEMGLDAMPTGRIRGRVLNEKGDMVTGGLELLSGSSYVAGSSGPWDVAGEDGFEFKNLPDGAYILVFNKDNDQDPDAPYPRTFYPGVAEPAKAVPITVEGGNTVTADIHVSGRIPVHHLDVSVTWANSSPVKDDTLEVSAEPAEGRGSVGQQLGPGVFRLNLFHGQRYLIKANLYCGEICVGNGCRGYSIETPSTEFDVPDTPSSALRINFTANECPKVVNGQTIVRPQHHL